ncbi:MAG: hypothetical protein KGJ88_06605 [Verrucomicrobiota bacterium]|nr:hypothetical protein [Verrucomicrobiota bacterium]
MNNSYASQAKNGLNEREPLLKRDMATISPNGGYPRGTAKPKSLKIVVRDGPEETPEIHFLISKPTRTPNRAVAAAAAVTAGRPMGS